MQLRPFQESSGFEKPNPFAFSYSENFIEDISRENSVFTLEKFLHHRRWVIKKSLKKEFKNNPLWQECLLREFEFGFKLDHKSIAKYFHLENTDTSGPFLIREWVEGTSLYEWNLQPRSLSEKMTILRQLAEVLKYLHSYNIYHRDLSPQNIIVCQHGHGIKLIDLGFAAYDTERLMGCGTPGFASPEQLAGAAPSPQQDFFAFGSISNFLFIGEKNIPTQLKKCIEACLHENPNMRPKNTARLMQAVTRKNNPPNAYLITLLFIFSFVMLYFYKSKKQLVSENLQTNKANAATSVDDVKYTSIREADGKNAREKLTTNNLLKSTRTEKNILLQQTDEILSDMRKNLSASLAYPEYASKGRIKNIQLRHLDSCQAHAIADFEKLIHTIKPGIMAENQAIRYFQKKITGISDSLRCQLMQ